MALVTIIIPIYNEQDNIPVLHKRLLDVFADSTHIFEIIFINDGSTDESLSIIKKLSDLHLHVGFINFSRNFGQQSALRAGYDHATGDAIISMDADLQNPPELVHEMLERWTEGYEIVACKRKNGKQSGGIYKEYTSNIFYGLLSLLSEMEVDRNSPDFRLLDRKLVDIIKKMPERDIFLRGIVSWMGFRKSILEYYHGERLNGKTGYGTFKMLRLALSGLTSFSIKPLYAAAYLGMSISISSVLYLIYAVVQHYSGHTISGWSSLIVAITFLGGLQLFVMGVIGIYLGKVFLQTKNRPNYLICETRLKRGAGQNQYPLSS